MPRSFTPREARELIADHNRIKREMQDVISMADHYVSDLSLSIARYKRDTTHSFLKEVPVEELFADLESQKHDTPAMDSTLVWKLKSSGFKTVADLDSRSEAEIAGRTGVSVEAAAKVVQSVKDCCRDVSAVINLRLGDTSEANDIIVLITCMLYLQKGVEQCRRLQNDYSRNIDAAILDLSPGKGRIGWLFTGEERKKKAETAYLYLSELLQGDYGRISGEIFQTAQTAKSLRMQTALQAYSSNPEAYHKVLNSLMEGRWGESANFAPFTPEDASELVTVHREILDDLIRARDLTEYGKGQIVRSTNKYIAAETNKTLKGIPVEEINRGKRGFKIGLLKENGHSSVADIYNASVWELEAIRGIGGDGARAMKEVARELFEETSGTVQIKLSTDHKTQETAALVVELAKYRQEQPHIEICTGLLWENQRHVENALTDLGAAGMGRLQWLFSSAEDRQSAVRAFDLLTELMKQPYTATAGAEREALARIANMDEEEGWSDFTEHSIRHFTILEECVPGILGGGDALYGLPEELARQIQEEDLFPDGLTCELRRYQEWGVKYILHQERVLLGDEMGLGKTVQAIAAMVSLRNIGASHFMVICPASVITNWCREIQKHSKLKVIRIHGSSRLQAFLEWLEAGGVAVTTYETTNYLRFEDFEEESYEEESYERKYIDARFRFSMLVVDEAHYVKNPQAKRTANVKRISERAERLLFMTGTALENRVEEMISLIEILQPQVASQIRSLAFLTSAPQFREKIAPVYYRRRREDVLSELPALIETKEWCTLTPQEDSVYVEAVLSRNFAGARRVSFNVDDLSNSSKAQRLKYIVDEAKEDGRKVLVFTYYLETIHKIYDFLGTSCMPPIDGSVPPERRQTIVDQFEKAPAGSVLIAQIQTGGTGLNIQSASIVIICEPQLKPSIENQAISRAYRMGQTRNVLVYRLLCDDTIDERITEVLEEKQHIFDEFADESVAGKESLELDEKTFGNIIKEEIRRIEKHSQSASLFDPEHRVLYSLSEEALNPL